MIVVLAVVVVVCFLILMVYTLNKIDKLQKEVTMWNKKYRAELVNTIEVKESLENIMAVENEMTRFNALQNFVRNYIDD